MDVVLGEGCDSMAELKALFFAASLRLGLDRRPSHSFPGDYEAELLQFVEETRSDVDSTFADFRAKLESVGWDLLRHHFDSKAFRFSVMSDDAFH